MPSGSSIPKSRARSKRHRQGRRLSAQAMPFRRSTAGAEKGRRMRFPAAPVGFDLSALNRTRTDGAVQKATDGIPSFSSSSSRMMIRGVTISMTLLVVRPMPTLRNRRSRRGILDTTGTPILGSLLVEQLDAAQQDRAAVGNGHGRRDRRGCRVGELKRRRDDGRSTTQSAAADRTAREGEGLKVVEGVEERRQRHSHVPAVGRDHRGDRERHTARDQPDGRRVRHRTGTDDRCERRDVVLHDVVEDGRRLHR